MICYLTETVDAYNETLGKVERVEKGQPVRIIRTTPDKTIFIIRGIYYEIDSSKLYCR
jgi:hypothetical protein